MSSIGQVYFDHNKVDFFIFHTKLTNYFIANEVRDEDKKKAILITCLSDETFKLLFRLCLPKDPETLSYKALLQHLEKHLSPEKCYLKERKKFYQASQRQGESVQEFAERLQGLASTCKFGSELAVILRDVFVIGLNFEVLQEGKVSLDTTFEKAIDIAASIEMAPRVTKDRKECNPLTEEVKLPSTLKEQRGSDKTKNREECSLLTEEVKLPSTLKEQRGLVKTKNIEECSLLTEEVKPSLPLKQRILENTCLRSWWLETIVKLLVFMLFFFFSLRFVSRSSFVSSIFALIATCIIFYI